MVELWIFYALNNLSQTLHSGSGRVSARAHMKGHTLLLAGTYRFKADCFFPQPKNTLETGKSTETRGSNISQFLSQFSPLQGLHAHLWSNTNEPWPAQLPTYETAMGMQRSETSIPVLLPAPAALLLFLPGLAGWSWLLLQPHLQSAVQTSPETLQVPQYLSWAKKHTCNYSPTQVKNTLST